MNMKTVTTALLDQGATRWSSRAAAGVLTGCMKDSSIPIPKTIIADGTVVLEWDKKTSVLVNADGSITGMRSTGTTVAETMLDTHKATVAFVRESLR